MYLKFLLTLTLFTIYPLKTHCVLEDLHDIIDVTYHLGKYLFGVDQQKYQGNQDQLELPWLRDKQKKVIAQIKMVSQDIDKMVDKNSHYMAAFRETTMNSVISSSQAIMLFIRIDRIRHRIDSMYRHMKLMESHMPTLEISTLVHMARWFVNPNSESVGHLLNLLYMELVGRSDSGEGYGYRRDASGLEVLAKYYQG